MVLRAAKGNEDCRLWGGPSWPQPPFRRLDVVRNIPTGASSRCRTSGGEPASINPSTWDVPRTWTPSARVLQERAIVLTEVDPGTERVVVAHVREVDRQPLLPAGRACIHRHAEHHVRVFPRVFNELRADGLKQWNANLLRNFRIWENVKLQMRADVINLQNRSQFAAPDLSPTSSTFGKVQAQTSSLNRFYQIQARALSSLRRAVGHRDTESQR